MFNLIKQLPLLLCLQRYTYTIIHRQTFCKFTLLNSKNPKTDIFSKTSKLYSCALISFYGTLLRYIWVSQTWNHCFRNLRERFWEDKEFGFYQKETVHLSLLSVSWRMIWELVLYHIQFKSCSLFTFISIDNSFL